MPFHSLSIPPGERWQVEGWVNWQKKSSTLIISWEAQVFITTYRWKCSPSAQQLQLKPPWVLHKYQHGDRRATYSKQSVFVWHGITGSAVLSFQRNFSVNMQVTGAETLLLSIMCVPYIACTCSMNLAECFLTISVAHLQYLVLCIFLCVDLFAFLKSSLLPSSSLSAHSQLSVE